MDLDALLKLKVKNKKVTDLQKNIENDQFKKYQSENKEKMAIFKKKSKAEMTSTRCSCL